MKKHIAILKPTLGSIGGLEKYTLKIAEKFKLNGDLVTIVTQNQDQPLNGPYNFKNIQTIQWPPSWKLDSYDKGVQKWVKNNQPDIVFGMERTRYQTHYRAGNGSHEAYLQSRLHTEGLYKYLLCKINPLHRKILEIEKTAFENKELKKLFTNSHMVKKQILENYKTDPDKIQVIHNGVEWHDFEKPFTEGFSNETEYKHLNLPNDCYQLLFIGNGFLRKGLKSLLQALSAIKQKDFHLSVVGKDKNLFQYQRLAKKLHLDKNITFFGPQKNIVPFYQAADSLIIPSFYDPFANVTVEALAMGLKVISSETNGGHEILTDTSGIIVDVIKRPDSLVDALEKILQTPKTVESAKKIRQSVNHLDFSSQLQVLLKGCE